MNYPVKKASSLQTEVIRPNQSPQVTTSNSVPMKTDSPRDIEITAIKKSSTPGIAIYWVAFFVVSAASAVTYALLSTPNNQAPVVKREVHKIYERVEIHNRTPAAARATVSDNYFAKSEARNKINQKYDILRQNLSNELHNKREDEYRRNINFYSSTEYIELKSLYEKKKLLLAGQKAVESCEIIGEDCARAQEYLEFKKNNPD